MTHLVLTRRALVGGLASAPALMLHQARAEPIGPDQPFTLGVASGDPMPGGVVIWTRLTPRPRDADGGVRAGGVSCGAMGSRR